MFITRILCKKIAPGCIWTGKHRVIKPVKFRDKIQMFRDLAVEEETMFYLSRPFLTKEQEYGHGKALGKNEERKKRFLEGNKKRMLPHKTTTDMLLHLRTSEAWE